MKKEKTHMTQNRSISFTDKGIKAIKYLKENSINVSAYIEKLLLNAIKEDFNFGLKGEKTDD